MLFRSELGSTGSFLDPTNSDNLAAEILHTIGMKLGTYISSYQAYIMKNKDANTSTEILQAELQGIWKPEHDALAAERYASLDSGVGATENDNGGTVRIFTA